MLMGVVPGMVGVVPVARAMIVSAMNCHASWGDKERLLPPHYRSPSKITNPPYTVRVHARSGVSESDTPPVSSRAP